MSVNKVDVNGETLIDLTADTVSPTTLYKGRKAHTANGAIITGEMDLNDMLAEGQTVLSSYQMGDTLPTAGTPGRVFFKAGGIDYTDVISLIYPIGSIYTSVTATNPSVLFGGTWEAIAPGRVLVGAGTSDANSTNYFGENTAGVTFYAGGTGGQMYHTLTTNEIPSHGGHINDSTATNWGNAGETTYYIDSNKSGNFTSYSTTRPYVKRDGNELVPRSFARGGGTAHNNMPPYLTVYMWKRTA